MSPWTPIRRVIAAGRVEVNTPSEFAGWWKDGYWIRAAQDEDYTNDWYITVRHPDGWYLYDGWWTDSGHRTVDEAVAEAFRGAELLDDDAKLENQNA